MGLVTKVVKINWNSSNKKHYEELGYIFTKYGDEFEVKVEDLSKGSGVKVSCICDNCGEEFKTIISNYNKHIDKYKHIYCRKCSFKLYGIKNRSFNKINNGNSFYDWCIKNNRQDVLDRWDYELNDCSPKDISYGNNKKCWFKCLDHPEHKSELKQISSFTSGQEGSIKCKQCSSIGQYIVDNYGEEFLWRVWSDKNTISPFEVSISSHKEVWWKCLDNKHEDYERSCNSSINYEFRCPKCSKEKEMSTLEENIIKYLTEELKYDIKTEYNCSIIPINPKTKKSLPFDNEIILENGKHLIIEVHGRQHYYFSKNSSYCKTKEELHYRQLLDRYKRIKCIQAGYEYLEIPYTAFDKEDTYKKLIEDKIKTLTNRYK